AIVGRRLRAETGIGAVRYVAQPLASGIDRVDVERQGLASDGARVFEPRDDLSDATRSSARDQFERLAVVERLDWLREPDGDVVGVDHAREPIDDFRELGDALGAAAGRRAAP